MNHLRRAVALRLIRVPAESGCHLQAQFQRKRCETLFVSNLQISGLAVKKHIVGIATLLSGEPHLKVVVRHSSIGNVPFQLQPSPTERQNPIVGQSQTHLRNGPGIDAQQLRTAAQRLIFQFHGLLFAANGQHTMQPTHLGKGLLNHHSAAEPLRHGNIYAISQAPSASRISRKRSDERSPQISIALVERAQSITIGVEPQRRLPVRGRSLQLKAIVQVFSWLKFALAVGLPPCLRLCRHRWQEQTKSDKKYHLFHDLTTFFFAYYFIHLHIFFLSPRLRLALVAA